MDAPSSVSYCPNCDTFAVLDEVTGFCGPCSNPSTGQSSSKTELALAANADAIEHYTITLQISTWRALTLARQDRAICLVCGDSIPHAPRNAVFCRRHKECRRYSRRYVYLYTERSMSKAEALAQILSEIA